MVRGEGDHDAIESGSGEVVRPDLPVGAVALHRRGHRQASGVEQRGNRPSDCTKAGMLFAHVVEQGGDEHVIVAWKDYGDPVGNFEGVALITRILGPEQGGPGAAEMVMHELLLARTEAWLCDVAEEPADQVSGVFPGSQGDELFLQSTQNVEVGRNSLRASPIGLPQFWQVPYVPSSIFSRA